MLDWQFFSRRRGITLKSFLSGLSTLPEAHERFQNKGLSPPQDSEILEALALKPSVEKTPVLKPSKIIEKQSEAPSTDKKEQTKAPAEPAKNKPVKKKAKSKKDEKYFRRVFPAKDKT
jgi:hypothetical protein